MFHYQYYYCFILFKAVKVESINDILHSHYLKSFPEDVRCNLPLKLIGKLFKEEYVYLNINDNINPAFIQKIKEKQKKMILTILLV